MRNRFEDRDPPSDEELRSMWSAATVVPDTNVLLNLYRYGEEAREAVFRVLEAVKERVWIPNQVASEYIRRRERVIADQFVAFSEVERVLDQALATARAELKPFRHHSTIAVSELLRPIEVAVGEAKHSLALMQASRPGLADAIRDRLSTIVTGHEGSPPPSTDADRIVAEVDSRVARRVSEGELRLPQNDAVRSDVNLWLQILAQAKTVRTPIIFVTDNANEDWWLRHGGRALGPRPELRNEIRETAGVESYFFLTDQLLESARQFLGLSISTGAITEVRELRENSESSSLPTLSLEALRRAIDAARDASHIAHLQRTMMAPHPKSAIEELRRAVDAIRPRSYFEAPQLREEVGAFPEKQTQDDDD